MRWPFYCPTLIRPLKLVLDLNHPPSFLNCRSDDFSVFRIVQLKPISRLIIILWKTKLSASRSSSSLPRSPSSSPSSPTSIRRSCTFFRESMGHSKPTNKLTYHFGWQSISSRSTNATFCPHHGCRLRIFPYHWTFRKRTPHYANCPISNFLKLPTSSSRRPQTIWRCRTRSRYLWATSRRPGIRR